MWQEIITGIIGLTVLFYIGKRIYRIFHPSTTDKFCNGCTACSLKENCKDFAYQKK